jgi:hypothetical protein
MYNLTLFGKIGRSMGPIHLHSFLSINLNKLAKLPNKLLYYRVINANVCEFNRIFRYFILFVISHFGGMGVGWDGMGWDGGVEWSGVEWSGMEW